MHKLSDCSSQTNDGRLCKACFSKKHAGVNICNYENHECNNAEDNSTSSIENNMFDLVKGNMLQERKLHYY